MSRSLRALCAIAVAGAVMGALRLFGLGSPADVAARGKSSSTPPLRSAPGTSPIDIGQEFLCPLAAPYAAYVAPGRQYFPPNHPHHPDRLVLPDRCFDSRAHAEAAGFTLAPPPPGGEEVEGVYLVPVDLGPRCERARARLGFDVPCPRLLPSAGLSSGVPRCRGTAPPPSACVHDDGEVFDFDDGGYAVPPEYGIGWRSTSLRILAFHPASLEPATSRDLLCADGQLVGMPSVPLTLRSGTTVRGTYVACPSLTRSQLAGALMLRWTRHRVVYELAIRGNPAVDAAVLRSIASSLLMV